MKKTFVPKQSDKITEWVHFDAGDQILGRVASEIAKSLLGKDNPKFAYNEVMGKKVVVTNAEKVKTTANKMLTKIYYRHTGFPGGIRSETLGQKMAKDPTEVLRSAVKGMLPKNKLRDQRMANLYIYTGETHPHEAQLNGTKG